MSARAIVNNVRVPNSTHLDEMIGKHVPDPPTLINAAGLQTLTQLGLDLGLLQLRADGDQVRDGQQSDRILVVVRETLVKRDDLGFQHRRLGRESLGVGLQSVKTSCQLRPYQATRACSTHSESLGSRSPDHWGIISSQILEQASHLRLSFVINQRISGREQSASRSSRSKPIASSESSEKREEVGLQVSGGKERGDLVDRVGSLHSVEIASFKG